MTIIDLGNAGPEPASVAEAKAWCRVDRSDEDGLIADLVRAARETVEVDTGLVLARRRFRLALDRAPPDGRVALPRRPLRAVTALTSFAADGEPAEHDLSAVRIDRSAGRDALVLPHAVAAAAVNGLDVEFEAGFADGEMPEALKLAVLRLVATSFDLRGAVPASMQPALIPQSVRAALAPFREVRI